VIPPSKIESERERGAYIVAVACELDAMNVGGDHRTLSSTDSKRYHELSNERNIKKLVITQEIEEQGCKTEGESPNDPTYLGGTLLI